MICLHSHRYFPFHPTPQSLRLPHSFLQYCYNSTALQQQSQVQILLFECITASESFEYLLHNGMLFAAFLCLWLAS